MTNTVYINGRNVPIAQAAVSVEDRGLQFGDSVYEVILVAGGRLIDADGHMERLVRSMARLRFANIPDIAGLALAIEGLPALDGISDGFVYVQVTRGVWGRNLSPVSAPSNAAPTVLAYVRALRLPRRLADVRPLAIVSAPDRRWGHCDIKTTALVGNMLARADALAAGADDAWLVAADGTITEATAANAWIVHDDVLITRDEGPEILGGITRRRLLELAREIGIPVHIAPFDANAVASASEAFQTSATALLTPILTFDGHLLRNSGDKSVIGQLFEAYARYAGLN